MTTEQSFDSTSAAIPLARRFVLDEVNDLPKELRDSIAVMVSELATNAVVHARSEFRIRVERLPQSVRVEVTDFGKGFPLPQPAPQGSALHGRGLFIVQHMANDWGITETRNGSEKSVWFRLQTPASAVPCLS